MSVDPRPSPDVGDSRVLYLGRADVEAIGLGPDAVLDALRAAFQDLGRDAALRCAPLHLDGEPGHGFRAFCAAWPRRGTASAKWLAIGPKPAGSVRPGIDAIIAVSDFATGRLQCLMDADHVTRLRTAGMSALAAARLADPDARSIGFVGCGSQARAHLDALRALLPRLEVVSTFSRSIESSRRFAASAAADGLEARPCATARQVVEASSIVVTSVPATPGLQPFLDPRWIAPGAFVAAVDVGRSWLLDGLRELDVLACEDHGQWTGPTLPTAHLGPLGRFDVDLAELADARGTGLAQPRGRSMFVFQGHGLADLAVASLVLDAARERGLGVMLSR